MALAELAKQGVPHSFVGTSNGDWSLVYDQDLQSAAEAGRGEVEFISGAIVKKMGLIRFLEPE